jgi:hypothetical protein
MRPNETKNKQKLEVSRRRGRGFPAFSNHPGAGERGQMSGFDRF